jgi:hypothetical protein
MITFQTQEDQNYFLSNQTRTQKSKPKILVVVVLFFQLQDTSSKACLSKGMSRGWYGVER